MFVYEQTYIHTLTDNVLVYAPLVALVSLAARDLLLVTKPGWK